MEIPPKENSDLILLLYFQMRKKFTKVSFTVISKTYYKHMYNDSYSHFVSIPALHRSDSGIVLRKVRIPTSPGKVKILILRETIPEFYRFLLCAEIYKRNA